MAKLNGAHLFNRQHRITYPTTIWLSHLNRVLNEKYTQNYSKKKRTKFNLGLKAKARLKNKIRICLNKIFLTDIIIETASLYFPINNEISPFDFINYLQKKNVTLSLPVIDTKNKSMNFKKWIPNNKLIQGPFGTMQPEKTQISILPQILVVPMLSFDKELYRLGYGGGYYDKSIITLKKHFNKEKKFFITIGLAYSIQEEKKLPIEKHDMRLDYIITENEILSNFKHQ